MEIKTRKHFNEIITSLAEEIIEEEDLDEITTTDGIDGYDSPFAFKKGKQGEKKSKQISTNSTGYSIVNETLDDKDIKQIKKLVRDVISNVLRDIWLKRTTWK